MTSQHVSETLSEHESKRLLVRYGIPIVDEALAVDPEESARVAVTIGFPVAVKLCGARITHKTERGLVKLGVVDEAGARDAAHGLLAKARSDDGDVAILVSRMVRGSRELIAGLTRDPTFGPCVMLGVGGILAEALADVVFRIAPIGRVDAEEMAGDLRTHGLLGEFRGEPAVDMDILSDVLCGLGSLAMERPDVVSVDVNPLVIVEGAPVAVDALVEIGHV